jgi:hypothetical protein
MSNVEADRAELLAMIIALQEEPVRSSLEGSPKLAVWIPDLERHRVALSAPLAPSAPLEPLEPLDRALEELLRALRELLRATARWRRSQGQDITALEALEALLFPDGFAFFARPLQVQAAYTEQLITQARAPEHAALLAGLSLDGATGAQLLQAIEDANQAILQGLQARAATPATANGYAILRTEVLSTLTQLRLLIERNLQGEARERALKAMKR